MIELDIDVDGCDECSISDGGERGVVVMEVRVVVFIGETVTLVKTWCEFGILIFGCRINE